MSIKVSKHPVYAGVWVVKLGKRRGTLALSVLGMKLGLTPNAESARQVLRDNSAPGDKPILEFFPAEFV